MIRRVSNWSVCLALVVGMCGCAMTRDWLGRSPKSDDGAAAAMEPGSEPSARDLESRLRAVVDEATPDSGTPPEFVRDKPHFYKEYEVYPGNASEYDVTLTAKDSRTVPYMAEVRLPKVRYATKVHRNRGDAREDTNFFRETGTETRTYELRYGDWVFVGSLFQVETKEEEINGEWVPAQEEVAKTVEEESNQGWFGRTWSWVTGR